MKRIILVLFFLFFIFTPKANAQEIITTNKLITVDLAKQMLYAWKDGLLQYRTPVSTGMYLTPTVKGSFTIQSKIPLQDMRGPSPYKNIYPSGSYLVKNVPNVMYFYQAYAIHGAYWHNNFGRPASHGCVNVPLLSAQWLYNWADVGTRVEIF
ncbi:MAG TPA: L,D-transpeptidase [Patescibacteria group bacterium]|nr:L,D-transpeptidase [Patescibacteria group bacterium]